MFIDFHHFSWPLDKIQYFLSRSHDKTPTLTPSQTNRFIADNLLALNKARQAYITRVSSERICGALLSHNIHKSQSEILY